MALDLTWVDMIHTKLVLVYGERFMNQYRGLSPADVKADWAHELSGVSAEGIKHALQNLPRDWPPNVLQFRDLCQYRNRLPQVQGPQVGMKPHRLTPEQLHRLREASRSLRTPVDPAQRAREMRERELRGESLSRAQRDWWRGVFKAKGMEATNDD